MPSLILASTSRYRAELLSRLRIPFEVRAPGVDESPLHGEAPSALAARLALAKARAVAFKDAQALVIGSDQVAHCAGEVLGKPGNHEAALRQLQLMRGKTTYFDTALALVNAATGREQSAIVTTSVVMRHASDEEIEAYVRLDQPFDCAGSARSEGLGIVLMERIDGDDPTALVGLPLIALVRMLRAENHPLLPPR
jgi:septum formation protein